MGRRPTDFTWLRMLDKNGTFSLVRGAGGNSQRKLAKKQNEKFVSILFNNWRRNEPSSGDLVV